MVLINYWADCSQMELAKLVPVKGQSSHLQFPMCDPSCGGVSPTESKFSLLFPLSVSFSSIQGRTRHTQLATHLHHSGWKKLAAVTADHGTAGKQ